MKALKHSPEHKIRKYGEDETVTAFGMMTSLQVHVTGYLMEIKEDGTVGGRQVTYRKGKGKETYFKNIGLIKKERLVEDTCNRIWASYMEGAKRNADGSLVGDEISRSPQEVVIFHDNRNDPKPVHKKKFYNKNKPAISNS